MKLLVFAHKPPPHHGQSYMVQLFLEGLASQPKKGGADYIEWFHVDARLSSGLDDIGHVRFGKIFLILKYCFQAIGLRLRHGITHFYYIPANPSRSALYRDWIVMALCRPFFKKIIFHWEAAGLGDWLETEAKPWERWLTRLLSFKPAMSAVLTEFSRRDADQLQSRKSRVVPNGIPDPCPDFEKVVLPRRLARSRAREELRNNPAVQPTPAAGKNPEAFRVLYLSLCHGPKGLFDTLEAIALVNQKVSNPFRVELVVAGGFWNDEERAVFQKRIGQPELMKDGKPLVNYAGFASGEAKRNLFVESDCLCFPTWYPAEGMPVVLVEAMAYGLPVVTTKWRGIPEFFPRDYKGIVEPKRPELISQVLQAFMGERYEPWMRQHYLEHFTFETFSNSMQAAVRAA